MDKVSDKAATLRETLWISKDAPVPKIRGQAAARLGAATPSQLYHVAAGRQFRVDFQAPRLPSKIDIFAHGIQLSYPTRQPR